MDNRPAVISPSWWIALVVSGAIVAAILAVRGYDRSGLSGSKLGDRFEYQIDQYRKDRSGLDPLGGKSVVHYAGGSVPRPGCWAAG